ncbi:ABC-type polysaccharide/polyol phosphate transport system ATPase subunit [Dysgonomonas alginatilytica]|uniref:ABC-type polysaccharide/polyol phosphate transport system ATPase subunit n=1 Tax=Dysgonomonas alginatilytica TaxID=1605892 RepID=A0A2V3PVX6_9BACT|nr:ABC transporter ATP-binding protein [Dysgonomonas alginatilytica]PXV64120.1 ABC-type polysaccharide/polyol phosphate transport system ATPase subunit [Dysgonomonas alginatilytica]
MSNIAIEFENISKQYRLGTIGTGTLAHDLNRWWHQVRGKEDPYLQVGQVNDSSAKSTSDYVWALKDISFNVEQGEVLGIIGKNGAGKSTLLKILSRVTSPTTGSIKAKGRIASLLEVGTGFHGELTGRENIYMNGAILGMTKREINRKFDEIVDFSGIEKYIDTPVKRYSSGMTVRLGFAIAAHLEPEILVVDEVLAVGDAEFQKKAIGKMKDVAQGGGRTVLFVSHNMGSIKSLCTKGLLLKNGSIDCFDKIDKTVERYMMLNTNTTTNVELIKNRKGSGSIIFSDFYIENSNGERVDTIITGEDITFVFVLKANQLNLRNIDLGFSLHDVYGDPISNLYSSYQGQLFSTEDEKYITVKCSVEDFPISSNIVLVRGLLRSKGEILDWPQDEIGQIQIEHGDFYRTGGVRTDQWNAKFLIKGIWDRSNKR